MPANLQDQLWFRADSPSRCGDILEAWAPCVFLDFLGRIRFGVGRFLDNAVGKGWIITISFTCVIDEVGQGLIYELKITSNDSIHAKNGRAPLAP
jgi:hypothetical protein